MPLPRAVARFNRVVTNRILGPLTPFLPYFATVIHTGRKSHRQYRTPIMVFPRPDGYTIALTYGPTTDWVRNVLASGECWLEQKGRTVHLVRPHLVHDPQRRAMPFLVRFVLGILGVTEFLELSLAGIPAPAAPIAQDQEVSRERAGPGAANGQPHDPARRTEVGARAGARS